MKSQEQVRRYVAPPHITGEPNELIREIHTRIIPLANTRKSKYEEIPCENWRYS
jgi:hypothetical protein